MKVSRAPFIKREQSIYYQLTCCYRCLASPKSYQWTHGRFLEPTDCLRWGLIVHLRHQIRMIKLLHQEDVLATGKPWSLKLLVSCHFFGWLSASAIFPMADFEWFKASRMAKWAGELFLRNLWEINKIETRYLGLTWVLEWHKHGWSFLLSAGDVFTIFQTINFGAFWPGSRNCGRLPFKNSPKIELVSRWLFFPQSKV